MACEQGWLGWRGQELRIIFSSCHIQVMRFVLPMNLRLDEAALLFYAAVFQDLPQIWAEEK